MLNEYSVGLYQVERNANPLILQDLIFLSAQEGYIVARRTTYQCSCFNISEFSYTPIWQKLTKCAVIRRVNTSRL